MAHVLTEDADSIVGITSLYESISEYVRLFAWMRESYGVLRIVSDLFRRWIRRVDRVLRGWLSFSDRFESTNLL